MWLGRALRALGNTFAYGGLAASPLISVELFEAVHGARGTGAARSGGIPVSRRAGPPRPGRSGGPAVAKRGAVGSGAVGSGATGSGTAPGSPPPGHPERRTGHPLDPIERGLWAQLLPDLDRTDGSG